MGPCRKFCLESIPTFPGRTRLPFLLVLTSTTDSAVRISSVGLVCKSTVTWTPSRISARALKVCGPSGRGTTPHLSWSLLSACKRVHTSAGPLASSHLHEAELRWVWGIVQLSEALRKRGRNENVADVIFAPDSTAADWASTLSCLWGQPCASNTSERSTRSVVPKPRAYATPCDFQIVSLCENQTSSETCIDGWTGPCPRVVATLVENGGPLPESLARLAATNLFKERPLTAQEQHALVTYSMKHVSGERRLCSRPFWLRLYGLLNTPGETALMESTPCAGMIVNTTGLAAPTGLSSLMTAPCGRDRYCRACEKFLSMLSSCYGACDFTDTLTALITRCVNTWNGTAGDVDRPSWTRTGEMDRMHTCGDHCPHRR